MLDKSKNSVGPEELDHLLNESFLEMDFNNPKNETIMQTTANKVMLTDTYALPIENTNKQGGRPFNMFFLVGIITLVIGIGYAILILLTKEEQEPIKKFSSGISSKFQESLAVKADPTQIILTPETVPVKFQPPTPQQKAELLPGTDSLNKTPIEQKKNDLPAVELAQLIRKDSAYVFPVLTEDEIKANHKQKKKMIEALSKFNKRSYVEIGMGTFTVQGQPVSLYPFYMRTTEVTNLEYRTFLYDLLIEGKKDEFLKAKPDQQQWVKETGSNYFKTMVEKYFSDHAYDNHPVVNVSREGAEMYCKWLTIQTNKILNEKGRVVINDMRLPTEEEWMFAALGGKNEGQYPWPLNSVQNLKGCFLANFSFRKFKGTIDTTVGCHKRKHMNAQTTGGHMLGDGHFTVWVDSYNPNDFGLYCMAGNVAEMVKLKDGSSGTKGGSWNSDSEHLKIWAEDEYRAKPENSPYVGFRPVISKNPIRVRMD